MKNPDNLTEFHIDIQRQNTLFNKLNEYNSVSTEDLKNRNKNPNELL